MLVTVKCWKSVLISKRTGDLLIDQQLELTLGEERIKHGVLLIVMWTLVVDLHN